ncbi:MAG: hypothetical protein ACR2PX_14385 [Endozoicomonas sp.]|uniref:hypothetical protein n=1 Tax=Endozoicomonas sp. TaxID=1892382 RepID=UPI003D9AC03E
MKNVMFAVIVGLLSFNALAGEDKLEGLHETGTPEEIQKTLDSMEEVLMTSQTCYSARKCKGKVLSHRDAHNCKVKSRGKSWRSSAGKCYNL